MTTEQIIKALECCTSESTEFDCTTCPYMYKGCNINVMRDALALIKEQQKELTYCYNKLTELEKECLGLSLHNITLKKEKKYLEDRLKEELEIKEDMAVEFTCVFGQPHKVSDCPITEEIDKAKADTVKKMQELIKERCIEGGIYPAFVASTIDQIAKEILEGE